MIELSLVRIQFREDGIFGSLKYPSGDELAVTLEHAYLDGGDYWPKLPDGKYLCRRRFSPKFKIELFEILDVPQHDFIEIHIGNYNKDSDGCVLVGRNIIPVGNVQAISASRMAFEDLMEYLDGVTEFSLTVSSLS